MHLKILHRILALLLVAVPALARASALQDHWFALELEGSRAGWSRTWTVETDERIETRSHMVMEVGRGAITVRIELETRFTETPDGSPIEMWTRTVTGTSPVETAYRFDSARDIVTVESSQGAGATTREEPWPAGDWLTPAQASMRLEEALSDSPPGPMQWSVLDPSVGLQPFEVTRTVTDSAATLDVDGRNVAAIRTEVRQSLQPGVTMVEYLDPEDYSVIRGEMTVGAFGLVFTRADSSVAGEAIVAPELMVSTFVRPDRIIRSPRSIRHAVFTLRTDGDPLPDLPSIGVQRFTRIDAHSGTVSIESERSSSAEAGEAEDPRYLEASQNLDSDAPRIRELAERALRSAPARPALRAERLRSYVHRYISRKALDVGFATATEVAEIRAGDCSEHAVLLAALLRADGIPSRVVTGLIYADQFAGQEGIFGYHMWTQALIDGTWVDLDATVPGPFDATHIAISASALEDGAMFGDLSSLLGLMGNLSISIESVRQ